MRLLQSEILDLFEKAKTREEKVEVLKKYESPILRALMKINFHPDVDMGLPKGAPPYKKETDKPIGIDHTFLEREYKKFYIWLEPLNISKTKKESLFIELLESLHHTEAEILCLVKDKELKKKYPSLTEGLVRKAYPQILPPKEEVKATEEKND